MARRSEDRRAWTAEEFAFLERERAKKPPTSFREIALAIERTENTVYRRWLAFVSGREYVRPGPTPPPSSLAEYQNAYSAPRTLLMDLMGDPLPGRSALDKRNQRAPLAHQEA